MKILTIVLIGFFLSSCTMYTVEKTAADGTSTIVKVRSSRDLEQPEIRYERGSDFASFDFKAANVDDKTDVMVGMYSNLIGLMFDMMLKVQTPPDSN